MLGRSPCSSLWSSSWLEVCSSKGLIFLSCFVQNVLRLSRPMLLLENVLALLSAKQEMRQLLHYVLQASSRVNFLSSQSRSRSLLATTSQEASKRGLRVYWAVTRLENCGMNARALLLYGWCTLHDSPKFESQVHRARVFFLCCDPREPLTSWQEEARWFCDAQTKWQIKYCFEFSCALESLCFHVST